MIRDQALFAPGLLVEKIGGPSVKPYQPAGLWKEISMQDMDYMQSHGEDLYRRSLYTFWKRTIAPPEMMNFDAANRETCVVRETRTNTPLQALEPDERRDLPGGRALHRAAHDEGRRRDTRRAAALRLPAGDRTLSIGRRTADVLRGQPAIPSAIISRASRKRSKRILSQGESRPDPQA